jgi:hypothetical protein
MSYLEVQEGNAVTVALRMIPLPSSHRHTLHVYQAWKAARKIIRRCDNDAVMQ